MTGEGVAGQSSARGGVGRGVRAITFICDTLYRSNTHCLEFSSRCSIGLHSYCLHKSSLRNLKRDVTPKNEQKHTRLIEDLKEHFYKSFVKISGSICNFLINPIISLWKI